MAHLTKIGIVLPYFGKLPNYFPLFLNSCRFNPTIDWLVYTDSNQEMDWPENVKVTKITFDAFRARIQKHFDFPICLDTPYKLCDFKPTYGDTLPEDLKEYDFWGPLRLRSDFRRSSAFSDRGYLPGQSAHPVLRSSFPV